MSEADTMTDTERQFATRAIRRKALFRTLSNVSVAVAALLAVVYGYERLRFPKPVFIGDTIHSRITIASKEDDPKRPQFGRVVEKVEVLNQRDETVLACEHVLLVKRKG